ncbi:hypothetical protein AM1_B0042 (plasmid) [Acaryochloris marina MBIC11017]|uniref:Uncharacterized protein n=1 Tax=Acaryochloris marina (strain MBIC 11017) TaxID=329726 RepID=A8ZLZ9_ACAM1|nr:hypothetical protein AM1_B0042 [Acaryochloris marina MBIC11017]
MKQESPAISEGLEGERQVSWKFTQGFIVCEDHGLFTDGDGFL